MNNLNPLLKHKKIGRVLGWDDFQNSTKEGIKKALKKERNKGRIGSIILLFYPIQFSLGLKIGTYIPGI
ncbi:MAG: hypothetical protein HOA15_09120 [Candidatus Marinimicrobia bacterium]|jgi:hypothetical protein|nr:hypothetical protein [Candidatus Neomarinimicrobiota bacterium]MBT3676213.1 hypothetical protein [Candidatus Neomarinimicrobiota bacterium]MBT3763095.1 hypothetical protein [Candidatus Neomarinimicrobiota bacterium]MBT4067389.1 hypothetical protein [Candidatus Neomarinimicrobiota bacterium]MBT4270877.1 hypothetical protein [Candidatus Neomarinimicrobiota bacterium]